jgi:hypothetical protein
MTLKGLLSKLKAARMLKVVVWFCLITLNAAYIAAFLLTFTAIPDANRADLVGKILTIMATTNGGELLLSAGVRLWGKSDEKKEG